MCVYVCVRVHESLADPLSNSFFVDSCFIPLMKISYGANSCFIMSYVYTHLQNILILYVPCFLVYLVVHVLFEFVFFFPFL